MRYIEKKVGKLYTGTSDEYVNNADDDVEGVGNKAVKIMKYKNSERGQNFMNNTGKMKGSAAMKHYGRARIMHETTKHTQNLYLLYNPSDLTYLMTYLFPQRPKM